MRRVSTCGILPHQTRNPFDLSCPAQWMTSAALASAPVVRHASPWIARLDRGVTRFSPLRSMPMHQARRPSRLVVVHLTDCASCTIKPSVRRLPRSPSLACLTIYRFGISDPSRVGTRSVFVSPRGRGSSRSGSTLRRDPCGSMGLCLLPWRLLSSVTATVWQVMRTTQEEMIN